MRETYIENLIEMKKEICEIVVLDADCSTSTLTKRFAEKFPESFFNVGIAEQNMIGIAAGLSLKGKVPVVNAFSKMLVMRGMEQIHDLAGLQDVKMILVGHYAGVSAGLEGATHYAINDVCLMRTIPNVNIYTPGNDLEIQLALKEALIHTSSSYIRLSKNSAQKVDSSLLKRGYGFNYNNYCNDVKNRKIILISIGSAFDISKQVANQLGHDKYNFLFLSIWFVNESTIDSICADVCVEDLIVVVDEHILVGSVGEMIKCRLSERRYNCKIINFNVLQGENYSGEYQYVMGKHGLDSCDIYNKIQKEWEND